MSDRDFEMTLERLFAEEPAFADGDVFVARVTEKLDRGWGVRQFLIGSLGILGGLIGGAQILALGLVERLNLITSGSQHLLSSHLTDFAATHLRPGGLALNGEVVWMAGALAAAAVGLALTRVSRDL